MKIAMIAPDELPPGGRARREARALAAAGHEVTVHGVLGEGTEPEDDEGPVVLVRAKLERWTSPRTGLRGVLAAAGYFDRFEPLVRLAVTRDPPEGIHVLGLDAALPSLVVARAAGMPFVFDDAGGGAVGTDDGRRGVAAGGGAAARATRLGGALQRLRARGTVVERKVRRGATACIATSDALADDAEEHFGGERPVVVRDCPAWRRVRATDALRVRLGVHPADRIVVFHGPPDAAHGVETAIRALRLLGDRVVLVIVGAAWCQDRLLSIASEAGVLPQVRVVSLGADDDAVRLVASAEVAVMPLSPAERASRLGLPAALFECLLAGTPVVVPDVPGAGALVRRAGAGIVVPASHEVHPNDVADGVRTLLADPRLRAACGECAARAAREELHWEKEAGRLLDLYERISSSL